METLFQILAKTGQFPAMRLIIVPLDQTQFANANYGITVNTFLEYRFKTSVVTPISDFSFTFAYPSQNDAATNFIHEGDIAILSVDLDGQEYPLGTGIIDSVEVQVTAHGETITVMGRDLLGQWEDQGVYLVNGKTIVVSDMTPRSLFQFFAQNTRTQPDALILQNMANNSHNVGVSPMESKLQVITRYLEPFNCLVWCRSDGKIIWGKPTMYGATNGTVIVSKSTGTANCMSMRATRSAATVPSMIRPILSGQELANTQGTVFPPLLNPMAEVKRLASLGHQLAKVYVSSDFSANGPQNINNAESLKQFVSSPQGAVIGRMNAYALREMARDNMRVLQVQATVPGHVNENGIPYAIDQRYHVVFDRAGIDCMMYLYDVEYSCTEADGPRTLLVFTYPNTIVAGNNFQ